MNHKVILYTLTIAATLFSCGDSFDKALCGEPEGKQKIFIDSVNKKYKDQLSIRDVPCYSDYMEITLKTNYQKALIDSLENFYSKSVNRAEFHVYDKKGKLIRGNRGSM